MKFKKNQGVQTKELVVQMQSFGPYFLPFQFEFNQNYRCEQSPKYKTRTVRLLSPLWLFWTQWRKNPKWHIIKAALKYYWHLAHGEQPFLTPLQNLFKPPEGSCSLSLITPTGRKWGNMIMLWVHMNLSNRSLQRHNGWEYLGQAQLHKRMREEREPVLTRIWLHGRVSVHKPHNTSFVTTGCFPVLQGIISITLFG